VSDFVGFCSARAAFSAEAPAPADAAPRLNALAPPRAARNPTNQFLILAARAGFRAAAEAG
jgi:hypothetical protein